MACRGVTLIFDGTLQIIVQRCQIAAPRWPNDINSAADNAFFKNRLQNIECSFGCLAHSAVLLKSNVNNILLFNFCEQKFVQYGPITIAIDCNGLFLHIFEEKLPNYDSGAKSAPNSGWFWVRWLFMVCVRVFLCPKCNKMPKSKWASSEKMTFFFAKIGFFWKSICRNTIVR